jgi:hypothetical protein
VFISYSRSDRSHAERLAAFLAAEGIPVWYDYEIRTGERFGKTIQRAVDECAAFVPLLTPATDGSEWVGREITYAIQQKKPILPVRLADCPLPIEIAFLDCLDLRGDELPPPRFIDHLRGIVTAAPAPETESSVAPAVWTAPSKIAQDRSVAKPRHQSEIAQAKSDRGSGLGRRPWLLALIAVALVLAVAVSYSILRNPGGQHTSSQQPGGQQTSSEPPSASASPSITTFPSAFAGTWSGALRQSDGTTWPMEVTVAAGQATATVRYTTLGCSGTWTLSQIVGGIATVRENISSGRCTPSGTLTLSLSGAKLDLSYFPDDGKYTADASLTMAQ